MMSYDCPICGHTTRYFTTQPFRRFIHAQDNSCNDFHIVYNICDSCEFIYSPDMYAWGKNEFAKYCYNSYYPLYDADVIKNCGERQRLSFAFINENIKPPCKHLDFGGGRGQLASLCNKNGYNSVCYDPFVEKYSDTSVLNECYNLVSGIEVFEHSNTPTETMEQLRECCIDYLYISTGLYDGVTNLNDWYYFNPRVGHISIFNKNSLYNLLNNYGFRVLRITQMHKQQMNVLALKL